MDGDPLPNPTAQTPATAPPPEQTTQPATAATPAPTPDALVPFPGPDEEALHYGGDVEIVREGITFSPDSLQIVPRAVAVALAGRDNIRIVQESPESWENFLAMRARVASRRNG